MSVIIPGANTRMAQIVEKLQHSQRLSYEDGLFLYKSEDLLSIGQLANEMNHRKNGKHVYFIENMTLYFTNVCEANCSFCNYRKNGDQEGAFTITGEQMLDYVDAHITPGVREFHITGGHNDQVPFQYYKDCLQALKERYPHVTIKAYTAAEVDFFSRISGLSYQEVLEELRRSGLDTMPGGGAEILSEHYRNKMNVKKASLEQWLDIHRIAHKLGCKTHATMLYGSVESLEERLQHMIYLRELQDETNGFLVFIPLAMQPVSRNAGIKRRTSAYDDLRTIALSRLMLDNFPHIKAYFINIGVQLTQLALSFGASDVHGTLVREQVSHAAGALSPAGLTRDELIWLIKGAGKIPVERDTFYNIVETY